MSLVPASSHGSPLPSAWTVDPGGALAIDANGNAGANGLQVTQRDNTGSTVDLRNVAGATRPLLEAISADLANFEISGRGYIGSDAAQEPSTVGDITILGDPFFRLWIDGTPGAAKLMVYAHDTNGTVVRATVALT